MSGEIGTKPLLRQIYVQLIADDVVTVDGDLQIPIETIETDNFSFYAADVIAVNQDGIFDVWHTAGIVNNASAIGAGVQVAILKRRTLIAPSTIDVILYISASTPGVQLSYKVYRIAGLD